MLREATVSYLTAAAPVAEAVHITTRIKTVGVEPASEGLAGEEKSRAADLGSRLSTALLARLWQMLLKGIEETAKSPNPLAAAEMVLIRIAYTSDLPPPDEIIKALGGEAITAPRRGAPSAEQPAARGALNQAVTAPAALAPPRGRVDPYGRLSNVSGRSSDDDNGWDAGFS